MSANRVIPNADIKAGNNSHRLIHGHAWNHEVLVTCQRSDFCQVQVWSVPGQRFQFTFSGHSNWVRSCCFSPDGRLAASGSDDKTVRIWDVATRQCLRVYDDHSGYVNTVAFHPDGTCVASAGTDNAIKVSCPRSDVTLAVNEAPLHC